MVGKSTSFADDSTSRSQTQTQTQLNDSMTSFNLNSSLHSMSAADRQSHFKRNESMSSMGDDFDNDLMHRIVRDTGKWAYGTVMVEVWVMNEFYTELERVEGGWWIDPKFHNCDESDDDDSDDENDKKNDGPCRLCQLVNDFDPNYVPPKPVCQGVGLPGALWSALSSNANQNIIWREVKPLSQDPHQPFDRRLKLIADCGIGLAAAVPFFFEGAHGMVIYMTKQGIDPEKLRSSTNEQYLLSASNLIGSAFHLRGPRKNAVKERRAEFKAALRSAKAKIMSLARLGIDLTQNRIILPNSADVSNQVTAVTDESHDDDIEQGNHHHHEHPTINCTECCQTCGNSLKKYKNAMLDNKVTKRVSKKFQSYKRKLKGANVMPPPPFDMKQTLWAFMGVFLTLLVLTNLNAHLVESFGGDFAIVLGPVGAFLTLVFGLTAAPAAQPRNAVAGQTVAMMIALICSYLPMPDWMKQSLATALAIAAMLRLGLTHPPAGASAMLFSTGKFGWINMGFTLIGNFIAIILAALIQDLNNDRQYPTFWGMRLGADVLSFSQVVFGGGKKDEEEEKKKKGDKTKNNGVPGVNKGHR